MGDVTVQKMVVIWLLECNSPVGGSNEAMRVVTGQKMAVMGLRDRLYSSRLQLRGTGRGKSPVDCSNDAIGVVVVL